MIRCRTCVIDKLIIAWRTSQSHFAISQRRYTDDWGSNKGFVHSWCLAPSRLWPCQPCRRQHTSELVTEPHPKPNAHNELAHQKCIRYRGSSNSAAANAQWRLHSRATERYRTSDFRESSRKQTVRQQSNKLKHCKTLIMLRKINYAA